MFQFLANTQAGCRRSFPHRLLHRTATPAILAIAALATALVDPLAVRAESSKQPNVIVILTDDQGWEDAGCYGSQDIQTPNIDALAVRGVRFTQFCSAAPVCSPSRAGLLTGRYPMRAGMPGNAPSQQGRAGMPTSEVTMAEMFQQAGCATAHIGKWHLGFSPETMPLGQGFDDSVGHMGGCIDNYSRFSIGTGPTATTSGATAKKCICRDSIFPI